MAFQNRDLERADCIQVNSSSEAGGVRRYGLRCPIAVIPNGIHPPDFDDLPPQSALAQQFPELRGRRIMLYLARLHQKKGLGHLLPAWSKLAADHSDWHLVIAGPDRGYEATARQLVSDLELSSRVTFTGPLEGQDKRSALASADVLVQPSFSEGFSMTLLEALVCRIPVLLTPGCHFPEAVLANAAVQVNPTVESTAEGLERLLSLDETERRAMGGRGRALVEARYTWDRVAAQTLEMYSWLAGKSPQPQCVLTNV